MASNNYNISATTKTPDPALPDVVLTLDGKSAQVLRTIMGKIAGSGEGRAVVDRIYNALGAASVYADGNISFSGSISGGTFRA